MQRGDGGVASLLLLALSSVLGLAAAVAVALASVGLARHRVAAVADLAALAAADRFLDGAGPACAAARRVVANNLPPGGRLTRCILLDGSREAVEVAVVLRPSGPLGLLGEASSTSRAGR